MSEPKPRPIRCHWAGWALTLAILAGMPGTGIQPAEARQPLRGSASYNQEAGTWRYAYYPRQAIIRQADRFVANYKLAAAEELYRKALADNPRNAGAWNGLGKIALYQTTSSNQNLRDQTEILHSQAIQHFRTALRYEPGYVEAHVNLARVYMAQARWGDAADALKTALQLSSNDSDALGRQGELLARQGFYNEALPYLEKAVLAESANSAAHLYKGLAHAGRGEYDDALQELQVARYQQPDNAVVYYESARVYERQANEAAALEFYRKALTLKPELTPARMKLASLYEKRGDWALALEQLKTVMQSETPDWEVIARIGRLSRHLHQPRLAAQYYQYWLERHPDDELARQALSQAQTEWAMTNMSRPDLISQGEARQASEIALTYEPENYAARLIDAKLTREAGLPVASLEGKEPGMVDVALQQPATASHQLFEKGELLLARYQFSQAEQAFRGAMQVYAAEPRQRLRIGELLLESGMPHLALEAFQPLHASGTHQSAAELGRGKAQKSIRTANRLAADATLHARKGMTRAAIDDAREALQYDQKHREAHVLLGRLYEKQKDYAAAADHYYAARNLTHEPKARQKLDRQIDRLKARLMAKK